MRKLTFYILISTLAFGCVTEKQRRKICATCPANNYKETYDSLVPKTKFIELPADESQAKLSITCPDGQQPIIKTLDNKGSKRMSPHQFDFKNNVLTILTKADSARIAMDYYERYIITKESKDRVEIPAEKKGWEKFLESFASIIFFLALIASVLMFIYWYLFKRKGDENSPPKPHNIT